MKKYLWMLAILTVCCCVCSATAFAQKSARKTVRDLFKLVPADYFRIYCCEGNVDAFVKKYVSIEDNANGYMEGDDLGEDPKYAGFALKVFPSATKTFVGLYSHSLHWEDYYFLELRGKKLVNVSLKIPQYSLDNIYEFPRQGMTIKVYKKKYKFPDKSIGVDGGVERGKFLYNLIWQNGSFVVGKR
ncbi:MAG: hypothetical protein ABI891_14690 [Acidobacteriota bacterium]